MDTILYPPAQILGKRLLEGAFLERNLTIPVSTKKPKKLPARWVQIVSNGGPRSEGGSAWNPQIVTEYYDQDDDLGEINAGIIHAILLDAPGVEVTLPGGSPFPWIIRARHVSGPINLTDEDMGEMSFYRSAVVWGVCPIP